MDDREYPNICEKCKYRVHAGVWWCAITRETIADSFRLNYVKRGRPCPRVKAEYPDGLFLGW